MKLLVTPYAISDRETGLLVPPKDSACLAQAIVKLLKDEELANTLGENGYKRVRDMFTWKKSAQKTFRLCHKALKDLGQHRGAVEIDEPEEIGRLSS